MDFYLSQFNTSNINRIYCCIRGLINQKYHFINDYRINLDCDNRLLIYHSVIEKDSTFLKIYNILGLASFVTFVFILILFTKMLLSKRNYQCIHSQLKIVLGILTL